MQTKPPEQPPEHEHPNYPWVRLTLVALVIIFLAIFAVIFIYANPGAGILFSFITALGLIFAFLQVVPSLFPPKKTASSSPQIIIHTPHPQSASPIANSGVQDVPASSIRSQETQNEEPEQSDSHKISPAIWYVPYRRNPFFTGRDDVLKHLHDLLTIERPITLVQPQAINGLGGVGKTQTVLEYAYRYREDYRAVLWARAESLDTLAADFVAFVDLLKLPEYEAHNLSIAAKAAKHWLETNRDWLLILDNADDLTMVKDFLPARGRGCILLTTRAQAMSGIAQAIEIDKMKKEEGALFLLRRGKIIGRDVTFESASASARSLAEEISQIMDGLPLALDQAGAYIEETACTLSEYLNLYRERHSALLRRRGGLVLDHPEPVATTWSLSFEKVEQNNPVAADLLRLCAFLHNDPIPEEIIIEGAVELGPILRPVAADKLELNNAIGELRKFSFVRRNPEISALTIHRLVQVILKDRMDKVEQLLWAERTVRAVSRVFPDRTFATWQQGQRYLQQIQVCAELIKHHEFAFPEAMHLLDQSAIFLQEHAYYNLAEGMYLQTLAIREADLGPEHPDIAKTLNDLAHLHYTRSKLTLAEPLYLRALAIREKALDPNHPDTARTLNDLARLYHFQGKYIQAEPLYQRALAIIEISLGPGHQVAAEILNNLARLYHAQGKDEQAEEFYLRALAITEKSPELKHPDTAHILNNLAILYRSQGKYMQAEELYQRALAIREAVQGPEHPSTAITLNNLARLYLTLEKYAQAEELYLRALAIREAVLGPEHPETATTLNNLAQLYQAQGKYERAEALYLRALAIRKVALGAEHPGIANIYTNLASLYCTNSKYEQAEELYLRALSIREAALGNDHPDVALVLENYIDLLNKTDRTVTANKLSLRVKQIRVKHTYK